MVKRIAHNDYVKGSNPFKFKKFIIKKNSLMVKCQFPKLKSWVQFPFFLNYLF